jgi:hypothetical protein
MSPLSRSLQPAFLRSPCPLPCVMRVQRPDYAIHLISCSEPKRSRPIRTTSHQTCQEEFSGRGWPHAYPARTLV